jgi:hypothetical protein
MTILPELKRELSLAARRLESPPARRWLRVGRRGLVLIPIVLVALGGLAFAATRTFNDDHGHPFEINQYRYGTCPTGVRPLGPDALARAGRAAVAFAGKGVSVTGAHVVTKGSVRSVDAERCGLLGKTVLVDLHVPAPFNSASMSQRSLYVSRIPQPNGSVPYTVWGLEH